MKLVLTLLALTCGLFAFSQDTLDIQYFKKPYHTETTDANKAKYAVLKVKALNGDTITYKLSLNKGQVNAVKSYNQQGKPVGIWSQLVYTQNGATEMLTDYNTDFVYYDPKKDSMGILLNDSVSLSSDSVLIPAKPIGGKDAVIQSLMRISYPPMALENDIQGEVMIRVVVNEDGSLSDFSIYTSVDPLLDKAAMDAVKNYPIHTPAYLNGEPIKVYILVPVNFKIG